MLSTDRTRTRLRIGPEFAPAGSAALALCLLAVWAPGAWLLGGDALPAQFAWVAWCLACGAALAWHSRRPAVPLPGPVADAADAEPGVVQRLPLATCICAVPGGELLVVNESMAALAGEAPSALLGRALDELCVAPDRERLAAALAAGTGFDELEVQARRGDGTVRWLSVSARSDVFRARPALLVVCHDITGHKQAQRSLQASEARFRVLLGALSEAVVLYDAQAKVLIRNRAAEACTWLDAAHAAPPGADDTARLRDEQGRGLPREMHPVMRSLADGQPARDVVIGTVDAAGQTRWLAVNTQPLFHAGASRPYAVVASYSDLTARVRAERALRASEQRYALALRGMNEGLVEWISGSDQLYVSPRLSQIMGYDGGGRRMRVRDFVAAIHPDDKPAWSSMMAAHLRGRIDHFQKELRMLHADGTYHWFMLRGVAQRDAGGRWRRVVGTVADISVSRRLEQSDVAERELLSLIAAATPLPDVMARLAVLVEGLLGEDARVAVFTFDGSEAAMEVAAPSLPPSFRTGVLQFPQHVGAGATAEASQGLRPVLGDEVGGGEAGGPYQAFLAAEDLHALWTLPLAGRGGAVLGSLAIYHRLPWRPGRTDENLVERVVDIAQLALERARSEREVRELHESLERRVAERTALLAQANRELEAFSYSVSHDLRSPLRAINGFAHLLAEQAAATLDDEGRDMLARIQRGATRMGQLIDDILHFSRMARVDMARSEIRLDSLARTVAAELAEQYPAARVTIGPLGHASGDLAMLRQVFVNLIGNALKFSSHAAQPTVDIYVEDIDGEPAICIRDNGIGFDPAYAERLFGVFQRMHGVDEFPGTGVGLAIVKRIVERHGGRVSVVAAPGRGATFRFTLDRFRPSDRQSPQPDVPRTGT